MGKRKKSSDFQKVKLRVGRKLPKGLNETDTSFSTRKIILREQLREDPKAGPTTHRKLGLKDLLSRLDHYSPSTRHESLLGLKELLGSNPNLIKSNLSSILEKSCPMIIDKEPSVRKAVMNVLGLVLKSIDSQQLSPFFPVVSSYVCCAMTHIVTGIRFDSLLFLDVLIETFPDLTVMTGNKIFANFLDQISSERDPRSVKIGRMLNVNLNEKISSQKWRTNVLRRMECFLHASLEHWNPTEKEKEEPRVVVWDCENPVGVTLYDGGISKPVLGNRFSLHNFDVALEGTVQVKDPEVLKSFISSLLPLLIETWVEASPTSMLCIHKGEDPTETMDCVLQVIKLLGECVDKISQDSSMLDWFRELFANDFQKYFLAWFPYSNGKSSPRKKQKHDSEEVSHARLNLAVCEIFTLLMQNVVKEAGIHHRQICEYLTRSLVAEELHGINNIAAVVRVVRRLLKVGDVIEELLDTLWWLCHHWQPDRKDRMLIVDFFVEIVSGIRHRHLISCSAISSWLHSLPREIVLIANSPILLRSLLTKVSTIAARSYPAFLQGLQENDTQLVALLSTSLEERECRHLVLLCSILPKFSLETFRAIAEAFNCKGIAVRNVTLLLHLLHLRLLGKPEPGFEVSEYLGFLQCIMIGVFKHEGSRLQQRYISSSEWCHMRQFMPSLSSFTLVPSDELEFDRHLCIVEVVLKVLLQFPDMNYLEKSVYTYINSLLESLSHLPVHSVVAIMCLVSTIHTVCSSEEEETNDLLEKLHVFLAMLTIAALCTCSCLHIVGQDGRMLENLREAVFNFVQISESPALICELLCQQLQEQPNTSPEEAECVGGVLLQLLRSGLLDSKSIRIMSVIINSLQGQVELEGSEIWFKDVIYEYELRSRRLPSRHKKR